MADIPPPPSPGLSVVIPVYNERECVPLLVDELLPALDGLHAEVIVIDDGSSDGTAEALGQCPAFRIFRIEHSGKSAALGRGIGEARGRWIVTIDADLQEDPRQIPELLEPLSAGADLVIGYRRHRADGLWMKRVPSLIYRGLIYLLFWRGFRDINCGFRAGRREVFARLAWFRGAHRLVPLMVARSGGQVLEVPVRHQPRRCGQAKYNSPLRFLRGICDLLRLRFTKIGRLV